MNWIKENQYLAGLVGTLVVGAGVFGYLIVDGSSRSSDARTQLDRSDKTLKSAAARPEVPVPEVRDTKRETVDALESEGEKLHGRAFERYGYKGEVGAPATFGQRVEARFQELRARWKGAEIVVPEGFFLGFEVYGNRIQANPSAVAELDHQLDAITWLLDQSLRAGVSEIVRFERQEVAGEVAAAATDDDDYEVTDDSESPLNSYQLVVSFRGTEAEIQKLLNALVTSDKHLFGVRYLRMVNSNTTAPVKIDVEAKIQSESAASDGGGGLGFDDFTGGGAAGGGFFMSDADRRAAGVTDDGDADEEVADNGAGDDLDASDAAELASLVEDPGRQNAVVFLGAEEVVLTAVLDFIVIKPTADEDSDSSDAN